MSDGYYRVDALRLDGRAGDSRFVRAANKKGALEAFRERWPGVADWNLNVTRVTREEYPMDTPEAEVLVIPPINEVIQGVDPDNPSDAHDEAYNAWATGFIRETLLARRAAAEPGTRVYLRTQYPHDTVEEGNDSRDLVTLGRHDEVSLVDGGVR